MKLNLIILSFFIMAGCQVNQKLDSDYQQQVIEKSLSESNLDITFYNSLIQGQKDIIAGLTGSSFINDSTMISSRWLEKDKAEARKFLATMLNEIALQPIEHSYEVNMPDKNKELNPFIGANVYSIIPATRPTNKYVLIGAHFDTVVDTPGASDNATGCALVYGVGKALTQIEVRNLNVILIFFDQEEQGPAGAFAFVELIQKESFDIHSVHTIDQIGWDQDGDRNIEIEVPTTDLKNLYKKHANKFGVKAYQTNEESSDKKAFKEAGFAALGITEEYKNGDTSPHRHFDTDTSETVNYDYLAYSTLLVFKAIEDILINTN